MSSHTSMKKSCIKLKNRLLALLCGILGLSASSCASIELMYGVPETAYEQKSAVVDASSGVDINSQSASHPSHEQ